MTGEILPGVENRGSPARRNRESGGDETIVKRFPPTTVGLEMYI